MWRAQADLTAFTTARVMQDALRSGRCFDIPVGAVRVLAANQIIGGADDGSSQAASGAADSQVVARPSWLEDPNAGPGNDAAMSDFDIEHSDPTAINIVEGSESQPPTGTIQTTSEAAASWGLDRLDQVDLPLNNRWSSGDYDGHGVHSEFAAASKQAGACTVYSAAVQAGTCTVSWVLGKQGCAL